MTDQQSFAPLWDTDDVAAFLKVPAKTIREWRHKEEGPRYSRLGKHVRYLPGDVMDWVRDQSRLDAA
ncbi:MAG: helix-turn-helix domain-containing protein [Actinophytocola sp.]|uniref:helix-turn-helix domain-containing protein n=1 Tax=Actinophytocola sp. TaxID=1872138 RepID=UPI003D6A2173